MDNHSIKAIIFDLGNVLINFDHTIAAKRISKFCDKNPQEIFKLFFDSPLTGLFEEGKILPEEFFLKVKEALNLKLDYDGFLPIWNEIFFLTPENYAVYNLAKGLKGNYRLALLSNINILHLDYLKKNFAVFDVFHNIITSCEAGLRKPHPLIYKKALDMLEISSPEEVFYTDDRVELIEKARELGIKAAVFKGVAQLERDLNACGINFRDTHPAHKQRVSLIKDEFKKNIA
jgi:putative hydrolase of the HAD superfamily